MLAWEHSGFSIDASVRISLDDRDVPSYTKSVEHLVRYCARPAFALERLSVIGGGDDQPERIRYTLPRHTRGQRVGPGWQKKPSPPDAQGVVTLSPDGRPATETQQRSHDTSRIAWAKLLARIAERFPVVCPTTVAVISG